MIYLKLFFSFFQVGLFSIGGGYAAMPLIQQQIVELNHWLTMTEFTDLITIAEMTPGPIAINSATFVGTRIAGLGGALIATLGCVLPSFIIVLTLAKLYYKYKNLSIVQGILGGLRPVVVAMIASAGLSILITAFWGEGGITAFLDINYIAVGLFALSLVVLKKFKTNPIYVMLGCGVIGMIVYSII
ncbi:MAG TPA: chromate transporter [Lachnospiraceae bacterium]|jgi:chromate transporter|nr:chromate transporter [Lachnospiraceae bacterium]HCA70366.1 chromate transporter [Lachnospiraceae bacterium]HCM12801.1 chromate transporter [Lachnospiraceae bacterium]HCR39612.1 chromate transporter [Lachnospiraceae bacterium]